MVNAARKHQRIVQTGSSGADDRFRLARAGAVQDAWEKLIPFGAGFRA